MLPAVIDQGMTASEFIRSGIQKLISLYDRDESVIVMETLLCDTLGLRFRLSMDDRQRLLTVEELRLLNVSMDELLSGKPVQYVTGIAYFMDIRLRVNENVLIPRPETEELIEIVLKKYKGRDPLSVLDIGCGSGCIAIQLALSIPGAEVTAIDTSEEAVALTAYNASWNDVKVNAERLDVLTDSDAIMSRFDLIVSNPPYIHPTESSEVDDQVLRFEPHLALFTPAEDVLIFYKKILDIAEKSLRPEGTVFFEVNPKHVDKLESVVISRGWELQKHVDISGKTRIFEIGKIS